MTGTSKRTAKRSTLGAVSVLALLAGSSAMLSGSADARGLPAGQMTAQAAPATPAPAAADKSAQPPAAAAAQPPREVEARIAELHRRLLITTAQEPQFKAYADVMRSNALTIRTLFDQRAKETDMSAVARLRWVARLTAAHAENLNKLVPVFDALYQSLSDQQKKAADAVFEELRQRRAARRGQ